MSRFSGDDEAEYNNSYELWQANVQRALTGKRGRKVLAELREALVALPERRLISGAMCTAARERRPDDGTGWGDFQQFISEEGEGVCAVGAYLWHRKVKAGADPREAFAQLPDVWDQDTSDGISETARLAEGAGVAFTLAWELAYRNDETFRAMTPEERHAAFIAWIDEQLADQTQAA